MKYSEMTKLIEEHYKCYTNGCSSGEEANQHARALLHMMENMGMLPPIMSGVYNNVPTVTMTGNHDYGWKRGWEEE